MSRSVENVGFASSALLCWQLGAHAGVLGYGTGLGFKEVAASDAAVVQHHGFPSVHECVDALLIQSYLNRIMNHELG